MRIIGRDLKKIIKEELTRAGIDATRDAIQTVIAKSRARTGSDIFGERHPEIDVEPMKQFFNDVFSGKKTVSSTYNSYEENLYINKVLSVFEKIRGMSDLTSLLPTVYPKEGIIKLQKATGIKVDGVFGRQTLAAAISPPGSPIINPSNYAEHKAHTDGFVQTMAKIEKAGAAMKLDIEKEDKETAKALAAHDMKDNIEKPLLLQALAKDSTLGGLMGLGPEDIDKINSDLPDIVDRSLLLQWLRKNGGAGAPGDTEESMAELQKALDRVSGERFPGGTYSGLRKGSVSAIKESLTHEPKNITERLMERWFK